MGNGTKEIKTNMYMIVIGLDWKKTEKDKN
jgi:hypothetical protein